MTTVNKKELKQQATDHINFLLVRGYIDEGLKDSMIKRYYEKLLKDNGYGGT